MSYCEDEDYVEMEYEIENQMEEISKNVKSNIENVFNDVTKRELSDSMFNLLMQNETYQKLNNSIKLLGK